MLGDRAGPERGNDGGAARAEAPGAAPQDRRRSPVDALHAWDEERPRPSGQHWCILDGAVIGEAPSRADLVLAHPGLGLALLQFVPHWTPDAIPRLQRRLAEAGFGQRFPGRLVVIHRRIRREHIPELRTILDEAFGLQPRLTLPEGGAWVEAVHAVMAGGALPASAPATGLAEDGEPGVSARAEITRETQDALGGLPPPEVAARPAPAPAATQALAPAPVQQTVVAMPPPAAAPPPARGGARALLAGGAIAAALVLAVMLARGDGDPPAPAAPMRLLADNLNAVVRNDAVPPALAAAAPADAVEPDPPPEPVLADASPQAAPDTPEPQPVEILLAQAPATPVQPAADPPGSGQATPDAFLPPVEEPPAPNIEAALAAPPPPAEPVEEPPAPNIEAALAAPPPPAEPVEEPPAPNIEAALAAPPPPAEPVEEPPAPNIEAALAAAPPPAEPVEEPPAPNIEAALAAAPPPAEPVEEPPAPNIGAALAAEARADPPAPTREAQLQPAQAQPAQAQAAAPPAPALANPDPPAVVGAMLLRGEALLAIGDISGARRFFERAAASGNGAAALAMGSTYDPAALSAIGARGIPPDRDAAIAWYRRALSLGDQRAAERLRALGATP